jgi:transporter family protein
MLPMPMSVCDEDQLLEAAVNTVVNARCRRAYLHDLRGGLQAISGAFELLARLARTGKSDPALVDRASAIARSALANHEGAVVEMLKEVVSDEEPLGAVDFGELIDETLQFLRNDIARKQIRLSVNRCDTLEVLTQKHKLRLLLLGLLTLRIDECPPGAELIVTVVRAENLAVVAVISAPGPQPDASHIEQSPEPIYPGRMVLEWASKWLSRHGGRVEPMRADHSGRGESRIYYPLHLVVPSARHRLTRQPRQRTFPRFANLGPMNPDWRAYAIGSALFAAMTAIFGKIGVAEINSDLATFLRTIIILIVSALVVWARHEWIRPDGLSGKGVLFLVLSGMATGLSWLCYYRALQLGPASAVAPIDKLSVVFVVIFAVAFLGERLTWKIGCGASLVALGAILMVL